MDRNWHLIALDGGSTDASWGIVAAFAVEEARVVIAAPSGAMGSGPITAFNAALLHSDAPYFMFCDQDDIWLPGKIALLLNALRAMEGGDVPCLAHSDMRVVEETLFEISSSL